MNQCQLNPYEVDKTTFGNDSKIWKTYEKLVKSNKNLQKKLGQEHFNPEWYKGFQQCFKNIQYIGSKIDSARIYSKFVSD